MQRNLRPSHTAISGIRRAMDELGFVDVWTPSMTRGTPEGARDFLVPVRLQPGTFFALAQSPQLFKQLCMVGGIDRYYQIATCWRDEDLRADRQFEFRQLDLELAFAEAQDVLDVMEAAVVGAFEAVGKTPPPRPFPQISFDDAMARFGSDKPDIRFGLEIQDATDVTRDSEFGVFKSAPCVRYIVAPKAFSRSELARLEELAKSWGAKGLAYIVRRRAARCARRSRSSSPSVSSSPSAATPARRCSSARATRRRSRACSGCCACTSARELELIDDEIDVFHWVVDFPLFEQDEDTGAWTFMHHPFTAPAPGVESWDEAEPRGRARPALRPRLERLGARLRLDPHPRRRAAAARVPHDGLSARRSSSRSSASCSRRSRWARRRTAASRWASTASSPGSSASPTSGR